MFLIVDGIVADSNLDLLGELLAVIDRQLDVGPVPVNQPSDDGGGEFVAGSEPIPVHQAKPEPAKAKE
jgi:hypothetical protein